MIKFKCLVRIYVCMSTNGHYAVEILPEKVFNFDSIEQCLIFETNDDKYKKHSKLVKLHKQFGHAAPNNLKSLFQNAGLLSAEILKLINEVCDNCIVWKTYKKPLPRAAVGVPRATTFNYTVGVPQATTFNYNCNGSS